LAVTVVKNSEEVYKSILGSTHNFMEVLKEFEIYSNNAYLDIKGSNYEKGIYFKYLGIIGI